MSLKNVFEFVPEQRRVAYVHESVKIFPLKAVNPKNGHVCYSFVGIPNCGKPKFLPAKAKELGCNPKAHYSKLSNMESVKLDNGNTITPDMVTEKAPLA